MNLTLIDLIIKVWRGKSYVTGRQRLYGPRRVSGSAVPERSHVHQPRTEGTVPMSVLGRVLGSQLRTGPGGSDTETIHGRIGCDPRLSSNYSKWAGTSDFALKLQRRRVLGHNYVLPPPSLSLSSLGGGGHGVGWSWLWSCCWLRCY